MEDSKIMTAPQIHLLVPQDPLTTKINLKTQIILYDEYWVQVLCLLIPFLLDPETQATLVQLAAILYYFFAKMAKLFWDVSLWFSREWFSNGYIGTPCLTSPSLEWLGNDSHDYFQDVLYVIHPWLENGYFF